MSDPFSSTLVKEEEEEYIIDKEVTDNIGAELEIKEEKDEKVMVVEFIEEQDDEDTDSVDEIRPDGTGDYVVHGPTGEAYQIRISEKSKAGTSSTSKSFDLRNLLVDNSIDEEEPAMSGLGFDSEMNTYTCEWCKVFKGARLGTLIHIASAHNVFICFACDLFWSTNEKRVTHIQSKHKQSNGFHFCPWCDWSDLNLLKWMRHLEEHWNESVAVLPENKTTNTFIYEVKPEEIQLNVTTKSPRINILEVQTNVNILNIPTSSRLPKVKRIPLTFTSTPRTVQKMVAKPEKEAPKRAHKAVKHYIPAPNMVTVRTTANVKPLLQKTLLQKPLPENPNMVKVKVCKNITVPATKRTYKRKRPRDDVDQ